MILHLSSAGSEPIELHIHDDAGLSISHANAGQQTAAFSRRGGARQIPGLLTLALVGVVGVAAGFTVAPRVSGGPARVATLAPPARAAMPSIPPNIPLSLNPRLNDAAPRPALPPAEMPAAVTQQLAQPPIVTRPPAEPHPAPGLSAFGMEN